jgi:NAD(P)-dependent dehydrogenase (short-subunit alcohol dehydrogenase family)
MKTAFVTGANRGIGKGFVDYFLQNNIKVFAGVRKLSSIKSEPNLIPIKIDIIDDESIKHAAGEVLKHTKKLDYLINNAGINKSSATNGNKKLVCNLKSLDRKSLLKMFDVNSVSPIMVIKEFEDLLKSDPSFVINISSCRASYNDEFENKDANYGYRASKAALNMMTFSSIQDLPENVKTFAVHPGGVKTDMNPYGEQTPIEQAKKMIDITKNWKDEFNGRFMRFDGDFYPF